ncbi:hypothetical protein TFLX_04021 [Thermoflexales bacterium]|nr:hypothetical protein TFLX_04021 [Thermoflexales bacterium]
MNTLTAPWWIWRSVQTRLIKWTLLLLGGRKYTVELTTEIETGVHYPDLRRIEVNPEMFARESVDVQFRATQGLLLHEAAHARYTEAWPEQKDNVLCELVNVLEDHRIEQAMSIAFPGAAPALTLLGDLVYRDLRGAESKPEFKAFQACLAWRWAHTRTNERDMLKRLNMLKDEAACDLWSKIKPLVEAAWRARDTREVIGLARDILVMLGIPASLPPRRFKGVNANGISVKRPDDDPASPPPVGPEIDGPGLDGTPHEAKEHHSGNGRSWTMPQPYIALEDAARPLAQRIVETLQEPRPNVRPRADATTGRYVYRLEQRDWERPFLKRADLGRAPRSLALHLLIDWSSSMRSSANGVRLALMALHLAMAQLSIPHAITFFGAGRDATPRERLETIVSFGDRGEWPKALIAGYEPSAGNEYLFAALDCAIADLQARPERDKIILVCTDGQPVWSGREGRDWDLSIARVSLAEQKGLKVIGLFLGEGEEDLRKMQQLFPRLIVTSPDRLPEKLGGMLISLA